MSSLEVIVFDTAPGAKMKEINYMVLVIFWALQKDVDHTGILTCSMQYYVPVAI